MSGDNLEQVHPMNRAILEAFLSGKATNEDVLDYLLTLRDREVSTNFKESLEEEINSTTGQMTSLLEIRSSIIKGNGDADNDKMKDGKPLRLSEVVNTVVGNFVELVKLYEFLINKTVDKGNPFNYDKL